MSENKHKYKEGDYVACDDHAFGFTHLCKIVFAHTYESGYEKIVIQDALKDGNFVEVTPAELTFVCSEEMFGKE